MTRTFTVLIVEDDPILGASLEQRLRLEGFTTRWVTTAAAAAAALSRSRPDAILSDIRLPDANGGTFLLNTLRVVGTLPTIFMTAYAQVDEAVQLMRAGAETYLTKPFDLDDLVHKLRELQAKRAAGAETGTPAAIVADPAMAAVHRMLDRLARVDSTVLLTGETGVGKEVAARRLHAAGPLADLPFVAVNCAGLPNDLADSEIFGHEKGAFTGAAGRHEGFAERAGKGMLFLDEVAELSLSTQAKLLRLLQERRFTRVGGETELVFGSRVVCATNADLSAMVAAGTFRKDLLYRLNVISVHIPPLRDRTAEIPILADRFVEQYAARFGRPRPTLDPAAASALVAHDWPGNIRELKNRIERALALAEGDAITVGDLFPEQNLAGVESRVPTLAEVREDAERRHIEAVLNQTGGRMQEAAETLGVSRTTLWERMGRLGLGGRK
ncbi:MAG: hypothetical protein RLY86_3191 [Pseudomonadota bacterium]|jgi:DNA-binding NtrC family response regulator